MESPRSLNDEYELKDLNPQNIIADKSNKKTVNLVFEGYDSGEIVSLKKESDGEIVLEGPIIKTPILPKNSLNSKTKKTIPTEIIKTKLNNQMNETANHKKSKKTKRIRIFDLNEEKAGKLLVIPSDDNYTFSQLCMQIRKKLNIQPIQIFLDKECEIESVEEINDGDHLYIVGEPLSSFSEENMTDILQKDKKGFFFIIFFIFFTFFFYCFFLFFFFDFF